VRRGDRAWKKIEGEEGGGGPAASQLAGGEWLDTWRGEKMGAQAAVRGVRERGVSSGKTRGRRAWSAVGE
jgi:hypothetical protein